MQSLIYDRLSSKTFAVTSSTYPMSHITFVRLKKQRAACLLVTLWPNKLEFETWTTSISNLHEAANILSDAQKWTPKNSILVLSPVSGL